MTSDTTPILTAQEGDLATIRIDRAERGNMMTLPMIAQLAGAVRATPATAKVLHLSSAGDDFCRGRDPQGNPPADNPLQVRSDLIEPILDLYDALGACPVPIVCSVRGAARGFGAALAVACDVTLAAEDARFSLPEMEKDLPPTLAMSVVMRRAGPKALGYMVYSLEEIDARTAHALGLVSTVVPPAELDAAAAKLLHTMCARSRNALVAVRDYQRAAPELGPRAARDLAANLLAAVLSSPKA